jgi:hypothetical protein
VLKNREGNNLNFSSCSNPKEIPMEFQNSIGILYKYSGNSKTNQIIPWNSKEGIGITDSDNRIDRAVIPTVIPLDFSHL